MDGQLVPRNRQQLAIRHTKYQLSIRPRGHRLQPQIQQMNPLLIFRQDQDAAVQQQRSPQKKHSAERIGRSGCRRSRPATRLTEQPAGGCIVDPQHIQTSVVKLHRRSGKT